MTIKTWLIVSTLFVVTVYGASKSNYPDALDATLYVFDGNNDESGVDGDYDRQGVKKRGAIDDDANGIDDNNAGVFSSYLKNKYSPKSKANLPFDTSTNDDACKGDDSKCADGSYRTCSNDLDANDRRVISCVDKRTMITLLKTGHVLAGSVYRGYYYDCNCNTSNVGTGGVETGTDATKTSNDAILIDDKNDTKDAPTPPDSSPPLPVDSIPPSLPPIEEDVPIEEHVPLNRNVVLKDLRLTLNTTCDIVKKATGIYTVSVSVAVEDGAPNAVVIGLNPYNANVRKRGTCDDRNSNAIAAWDSFLWDPTINVNAPRWNVTKTSVGDGFSLVTYRADFTIDDLFGCLGPNGENNLIVESVPNVLYEGTWFISKVAPKDVNDETLGESLQYKRECAFQIHQSGKGIDTLYYRHHDKSTTIDVRWLLSLCTELGRVAFNVRTCVEKTSSRRIDGNVGKYLFDPTIGSTKDVTNDTFSISLVKGGGAGVCNSETIDSCCQDWLIQGLTEEAEPPFSGAIEITWKYGTVDGSVDDATNVMATVSAHVLDACDESNDVVVNDTLEGHVRLFRDPNFSVPYDCCSAPPIVNSHRFYASLALAINPALCEEFVGLIVNITLVYHKEGATTDDVPETVLIYDVNDPNATASRTYDVIVETHPKETCNAKISWLAIKKSKGNAKVEVVIAWNATHVPYANGYPIAHVADDANALKTNALKTSRFAPSVRTPVRDASVMHYGTHSKELEKNMHVVRSYRHFTNKFAIYKESAYDRAHHTNVKKNREKISNLAMENVKFVRFRFADRVERKSIEMACSEFSEWSDDDGECSSGSFFHWFPGAREHPHQRGWVLALVVFFLFLLLLPFLCCICMSHHRHHHHHDHKLPGRHDRRFKEDRSNQHQQRQQRQQQLTYRDDRAPQHLNYM